MKRSISILIATLTLAACSHPLEPAYDPVAGTYSVDWNSDRLAQHLVFSNISPKQGEVVTVKATVVNLGESRELTTRICGLDWAGITVETPGAACAGYSQRTTVPTNGIVETFDSKVIKSPPGDYTVKIRHVLDPEQWVEFKMHVKAP